VTAKVAALQEPQGRHKPPLLAAMRAAGDEPPSAQATQSYWSIDRARPTASGRLTLELVLNGRVIDRREIPADGGVQSVAFECEVDASSWIALRLLPAAHTAAVAVVVAGRPIRASRRSAQWCLDCLDKLWTRLSEKIRPSERTDAAAAWDHARGVYRDILAETPID
jgi:hypothetical protein